MLDHRGAASVPSRARRPRVGRRVLLAGLVGTAGVAVLGRSTEDTAGGTAGVVGRDATAEDAAQVAPLDAPGDADAGMVTLDVAADVESVEAAPVPLLARLGALQLHAPSSAPVLVAYHEASTVRAHPLVPTGRVRIDGNPTRFDPPPADARGVTYDVQVSRGRSAGPTSAVDIVLEDDDPVLAPVSGTVVESRPYLLYGRHDDVRIELRPDDAPGLAVVLIHVRDPLVTAGDRVGPGMPLAAGARRFPFHSIVDTAVAPRQLGHVHLEVSDVRPVQDQDAAGG